MDGGEQPEVPDDFAVLFVTGLPPEEDDVRAVFADIGIISNMRILPQKDDMPTRAGVITFSTHSEAVAAIAMDGQKLEATQRRIKLKWDTRSLERRLGGSGGQRNGGGGFGRIDAGESKGFGNGGGFGGGGGGFGRLQKAAATVFSSTGDLVMHEGRPLMPFKGIVGGQEKVIGFLYKDVYDTHPASAPVPGTETAPEHSGGFGFGRLQSTAAEPAGEPKVNGESKKYFGRSTGDSAATEEKDTGPGFGLRIRQKTIAEQPALRAEEPKAETKVLDDIIPDLSKAGSGILGGRYGFLGRRRTIDAEVSNTRKPDAATKVPADKPAHPPIGYPMAGEPHESVVSKMAAARRGARMAAASSSATIDPLPAYLDAKLIDPANNGEPIVVGSTVGVQVAHIFADGTAAVWLADQDNEFPADRLTKKYFQDMKQFYSMNKSTTPIKANMPVAVFKLDDWFRGKCISEGASKSRCFLVDWGEEDEVDNAQLQPLDKSFGDQPPGVYIVSIARLTGVDVSQKFRNDLMRELQEPEQQALDAMVLETAPRLSIQIDYVEKFFLKEMQKEKKAGGFKPEIGTLLYVDPNNGMMFIVNGNEIGALGDIQSAVQKDAEKNLKPDFSEAPHAVLFTDGIYYRGIVFLGKDGKYEVELMDYGNCFIAEADKIRGLSDELKNKKEMSIAGHLDGNKQQSKEVIAELEKLIDKNILYEVMSTSNGYADFRTWDEAGKLVSGTRKPTSPKKADNGYSFDLHGLKFQQTYKVGDDLQGYVSIVTDPEQFFFNHSSVPLAVDPGLQKLTEELNQKCPMMPKLYKIPAVGSVVCGLYLSEWYRALVLEVLEDQKAEVLYVDYGNTEIVQLDILRGMTKEWMQLPRMVLPCLLEGVANKKFSEDDISKATELLADKEGKFRITQVDENGEWFAGVLTLGDGKKSAVDMLIGANVASRAG